MKSFLLAALAVATLATTVPAYAAEGKYATEAEAKTDLDTCGYFGKWKSAKEGVTRENPTLSGPAYWDAVRLYFLELGGCWVAERTEPAPIDWAAPLPRTTPLVTHPPLDVPSPRFA